MQRVTVLAVIAWWMPALALAHSAGDDAIHRRIEEVLFVAVLAGLAGGACLYVKGVGALWRRAGVGRGIRRVQSMNFAFGWLALAVSLLPPLDDWADRSFAMHMIQHEMLMVVAAPLIVLGRPLDAWTWAVPKRVRHGVAAIAAWHPWQILATVVGLPLGAWIVHAAAIWAWHLPSLFRIALADPLVHVLQHGCFFFSALVYWWSVFGGRAQQPKGGSIASLFTTMLHTSALGALLTFAPTPWYVANGARLFGLSALEDQELGGLIMWVPGGLAYLFAALEIVHRWLVAGAVRTPWCRVGPGRMPVVPRARRP